MNNRYTIIKDLVVQACDRLRKMGISIDESYVDSLVQQFYSGDATIAQINEQIIEMETARKSQLASSKVIEVGISVARNLQNLSVQHMGITLNNQDIDLMMIANAESFKELELAMNRITNISLPPVHENEGFIEYRQRVFDSYLGSLASVNDSLKNKDLELQKKLEYLSNSDVVSLEDMEIIYRIISENKEGGVSTIFAALSDSFSPEKIRDILLTMRDFSPIEKEGILSTTLEGSRELYKQIAYHYDSITIDEEGKYGKLILHDWTFNPKHLIKSLDFARSMGKTVRINTLMFYMDCREDIYNLDESSSSTRLAKEKLEYYVDETTKVLANYPDVVRSVDVFNELLNRFPIPGNVPYMLRGDIPQDLDGTSFDNINSGWLKHLSVEDICDVLSVARANLPNVDFMYNDDHLVDPEKLEPTIELIKRIQDYSKTLGIKLIDSIGTQMHIDNNVSKDQIRNMFLRLSELGLPIEITEFDLAMTSGVEGLTPEQIEIIRQQKINEVYEVVEELRSECNIRGFTIWSKTDSQNFRVKLANEALVDAGKEPTVETLHGGFFTEGMRPKSSELSKSLRKQNFNYHGHTSRCGHASEVSDQLYVEAARNAGIDRIGFSDHIPESALNYWQVGKRMYIDEAHEYIGSVKQLQKDNPDMIIRCGFEAEYSLINLGHLVELREQCDYMILGQHYVKEGMHTISAKDNPEYPLLYAKAVCEGLETGMFDILAHPDYFMRERERFSTEEGKALFIENAKKASYMICLKAKEMGIPLELNLSGPDSYLSGVTDSFGNKVSIGTDGELAYPHSLFWQIASEVSNDVIYGIDSHYTDSVMKVDEKREYIESKIDVSKLKFASDAYDPVIARESNLKLQDAYKETVDNSVTVETAMIQLLLSGIDVSEGQEIHECLVDRLSDVLSKLSNSTDDKKSDFDKLLAEVDLYNDYPLEKREELRKKYDSRLLETQSVRETFVSGAIDSLNEAKRLGCKTKEEYVEVVGLLTEAKTQSNPMKLSDASSRLQLFEERKKSEVMISNGDAPKTYVHSSNATSNGNDSGEDGFSNSYVLLFVIGVLFFLGFVMFFIIR